MQGDSSSDEVDKSSGQLNSVSPDSVAPVELQITASPDNNNTNCEKASKKKKKRKKNMAEDVQIDNEGIEKETKEQIVDAEETPKTKKLKKKKKMKAAGLWKFLNNERCACFVTDVL